MDFMRHQVENNLSSDVRGSYSRKMKGQKSNLSKKPSNQKGTESGHMLTMKAKQSDRFCHLKILRLRNSSRNTCHPLPVARYRPLTVDKVPSILGGRGKCWGKDKLRRDDNRKVRRRRNSSAQGWKQRWGEGGNSART